MEVKIGVQHAPRELIVETSETPDAVQAAVEGSRGSFLDRTRGIEIEESIRRAQQKLSLLQVALSEVCHLTRMPETEVPAEELIWQDPVPRVDHPLVDTNDIAALKKQKLRLKDELERLRASVN